MGVCISTNSVTEIDPATGLAKTKTSKKKGGGSSQYPGNRRTAKAPYVPNPDEFAPSSKDGTTRVATKHFVSYGGGNALVLVDGAPPPPAEGEKKYVQVTLPPGVKSGQEIQVQTPDGTLVSITVPPGMGEGSTFTVEFNPNGGGEQAPPPTTKTTDLTLPPATAPPLPPPVPYTPTNYSYQKEEPDIPFATAVPVKTY